MGQRYSISGTLTGCKHKEHKKNKLPYHVSGPLVGLSLRVDEERPASGELHDDAVLYGQVVLGQAGDLPAADVDRVAHGGDQVGVLGAGHLVFV